MEPEVTPTYIRALLTNGGPQTLLYKLAQAWSPQDKRGGRE